MGVDLRAAAVHDDDPDPGVAQEHDVLGERRPQRFVRHRVSAVLHDDRPPVEPLEPRQCLDQYASLGEGIGASGHVEYAEFSCTYAVVRSVVWTTAEVDPACRSMVMLTSRELMSTVERSAAAAPALHTQTPLIATSR